MTTYDQYRFADTTHQLECYHQCRWRKKYYMACIPLGVTPKGKEKILVFGNRNWDDERKENKRIRYVDPGYVTAIPKEVLAARNASAVKSVVPDAYSGQCVCHACIKQFDLKSESGISLAASQMILCPTCGNKRCPHASDHRLACTGSNEPGQAGSVYQ